MSPRQARLVTACQQLLVLGVVVAVLTPAAAVVSLDVIGRAPYAAPAPPSQHQPRTVDPADRDARRELGSLPASATTAPSPTPAAEPATEEVPAATVPAEPVQPVVREVALTEPEQPAEPAEEPTEAPAEEYDAGATRVVSDPQPVADFGTVGVTWSGAEEVDEDRISLTVRTRTAGQWGEWLPLEYHDDHAPDPDSAEATTTRGGTDPRVVGAVDAVQVAATATGALPDDLSLVVVEPGRPERTETEQPRIVLTPEGATTTSEEAAAAGEQQEAPEEDGLALRASVEAPRPRIFSREQWGADESLRDGRPSYGSISGGFVHHTVNGNDYEREDVPGIIRSIYAYHTRSRGWSDIGYNFLVDKFGRIWEGRYGGVARPVVGAHTYGYNSDSFAMSAIGNYETAHPTDAMLDAYGELFAWKLALHDVRADDMHVSIDGEDMPAINGHRDAGSTACPGEHLYDKLRRIRELAAAVQDAGGTEEPQEPEPPAVPTIDPVRPDSNLVGTPYPDLAVRRAADKRGMILPTGGLTRFRRPRVLDARGWDGRTFVTGPDVTGDGTADLFVVDDSGALEVRPGRADGGFGGPVRTVRSFRGHKLLAAVGDVTGDGRADLAGKRKGRLVVFKQTRRGGFRSLERRTSLRGYQRLVGAGDVTGDGRPDLWGRNRKGRVFLHRATGPGTFTKRQAVPGDWTRYDWFVGGADYTQDGVPDLLARTDGGDLMVVPARRDGTVMRPVGPVRKRVGGLSMVTGADQVVDGTAPDLVAAREDGSLVVLPSRGTYELGQPIDTGRSFRRLSALLNASDFDGDGDGDVLARKRRGAIVLFRGDGTGRLAEPVKVAGRRFRKVEALRVIADVTSDGLPDLLGRPEGEPPTVWPGAGAARVGEPFVVKLADDSLTASGSFDWRIRVSDLRGRGRPDLVVRETGTGYLYRVNGRRKGASAPRYLGQVSGFDRAG